MSMLVLNVIYFPECRLCPRCFCHCEWCDTEGNEKGCLGCQVDQFFEIKRLKNEGLVVSKSHRKELHGPGAILMYATSEKGDKIASHLVPLVKLFYPEESLQVKEGSSAPEVI